MLFRLKIVFTIILLSVFTLIFYANNWQSPGVNQTASSNIHQCIYESSNKKNQKLSSLNNEFDITYVENSGLDCPNPHFPTIHITTKTKHNAWLHIIYTDRDDNKENKVFIDTIDQTKAPDIYPFYSLGQDFYDAPLWHYGLYSKPLNYWKGQAWAVDVNFELKLVRPIGGVSWGFNLPYNQLRPKSIKPGALSENDWNQDWEFFKILLPGFKFKR